MGRQQRRRRERRQHQRQQTKAAPAPRSRLPLIAAIGVAAVLVAIIAIGYAAVHRSAGASPTPTLAIGTPESLAPAVDGIQCGAMESLAYHIHQHLTLYNQGKQVQVPSEIGIPGGEQSATCFYWIHVHSFTPGIIHVESPIHKTFTLGNFFDIWKATRSSASPPGDAYVLKLENAARQGNVTAFVNGRRWSESYRSIPLKSHSVITVEIGKPVLPPRPFTNWGGL